MAPADGHRPVRRRRYGGHARGHAADRPRSAPYQAASSEIFGEPLESPQSETISLAPVTPYGVAQVDAHFLVNSYRRRMGSTPRPGSCTTTTFRRPVEFVPRKVANAAARIVLGIETTFDSGALTPDATGVRGGLRARMWLMLQQDQLGDYVIATEMSHSVEELARIAFGRV